MRQLMILVFVTAGFTLAGKTQQIEVLSADSVRLTSNNGNSTLIVENSTRHKNGFLTNRGNGRTAFSSILSWINDSTFLIGIDTLKLVAANAITLNGMDTVRGVKVFNPVVQAFSDTLAGTVFNSNFSPATITDTVIGVDVKKMRVTGTVPPLRIPYGARFSDKVIFEDDIDFFRSYAFVKNKTFYSNSWIRATDNPGMKLVKPSNASPVQLLIQQTQKSTSRFLKDGTVLRDSVFFTDGFQDYAFIKAVPVLSQQNGAQGPLRAFYIEPALIGVSGFRGVQVDVNAPFGYALSATGTAASQFGGVVEYLGNYSNSFTERSLVNKAFIDSAAGPQWQAGVNGAVYRISNVALGQSANPDYLAAVNGTVLARKATVSDNGVQWPDFVFEAGYKLKTLKETEAYVKEHKHLPDMPSVAIIQKEGIDVAIVQAALLRQVEELTLRLLNQHDKLQEQSKKIAALESVLPGSSQ